MSRHAAGSSSASAPSPRSPSSPRRPPSRTRDGTVNRPPTCPRCRSWSARAARSPRWTGKPARSGSTCSRRAATPPTRRSPRRLRWASPSPTAPASAVAGSSSTTTPRPRRSRTIDGRETAPKSFTPTVFQNPDGTALDFNTVVNSGLSVGTPGTPALWDRATRGSGRGSSGSCCKPAEDLAESGFVVDQTFRDQTASNEAKFRKFPATVAVYLPGNALPVVGSTFRNPDMAAAYKELRTHGVASLYGGKLGQAVVDEAQDPSTAPGVSVYPGQLDPRRPRGVPRPGQGPGHLAVQGVRRLRDVDAELGRHRRRGDAQPHRGVRDRGPGPA